VVVFRCDEDEAITGVDCLCPAGDFLNVVLFVARTGYGRSRECRDVECPKVEELVGDIGLAGGSRVEYPVRDLFAKSPFAYRTEDDAHCFG